MFEDQMHETPLTSSEALRRPSWLSSKQKRTPHTTRDVFR